MSCTSEAFLQVLPGAGIRFFHKDLCYVKHNLLLSDKYRGERGCRSTLFKNLRIQNCSRIYASCGADGINPRKKRNESLEGLTCKCQGAQNVGEATAEKGNRTWINGVLNDLDGPKFDVAQQLKNENGGVFSNIQLGTAETIDDKLNGVTMDSIEDEAWNLLRASMVYYCGNPIGTIAANDPNDSSILNYDQVFIRDFIPSGIAFLLKGEYDIVRNFILHTLQLQVIY